MSLGFGPAGSSLGSLSGALRKAALVAKDSGALVDRLVFSYNPTQVVTKKSASWKRDTTNAASSASHPKFTGPDPQTVEMEIFFDAWNDPAGDVSVQVNKILGWTRPTQASRNRGAPSPPLITIEWGASRALAEFCGYLKDALATYTVFRADGSPIRATCKITLEEVPDEAHGQNPTSGSLKSRRTRTVRDGENLALLAYQEYGDPGLWRGLARFNGLDDPLALAAGTRLLVPSLSEAAELSKPGGD